jgi:hypothetical protein
MSAEARLVSGTAAVGNPDRRDEKFESPERIVLQGMDAAREHVPGSSVKDEGELLDASGHGALRDFNERERRNATAAAKPKR